MSELLRTETGHGRENGPGRFVGTVSCPAGREKSVILLVTRNANVTETAMDYAFSVAERLDHRLLIAYVNTLPFLWEGGHHGNNFTESVHVHSTLVKRLGRSRGLSVNCIKDTGRISKVVSRLCRILKKIEFIIVDQDIRSDEIASRCPVPVFCVSRPKQTVLDSWKIHET